MGKISKRFPEPPKNEDPSTEELRKYLNTLIRELTETQVKNISGPINSTPFVPKTFTDTRTLDASSASLQNVRDCLCTLIQILKDGGLLK